MLCSKPLLFCYLEGLVELKIESPVFISGSLPCNIIIARYSCIKRDTLKMYTLNLGFLISRLGSIGSSKFLCKSPTIPCVALYKNELMKYLSNWWGIYCRLSIPLYYLILKDICVKYSWGQVFPENSLLFHHNR